MPDQGELRATSDKMMAMIGRLSELEAAKRHMAVGTPEFITAADEIEQLARVVFRWSQIEAQLAHRSGGGEVPATPIAEVAPRPLDRILADWREAQLRLEVARPGSPASEAAVNDVERLREEYRASQESRV